MYRDACAPPRTTPLAVTVLPFATVLSANAPVAPEESMLTVSPLTTPLSVAAVKLRVAVVDRSYSLFEAVMPEMVRALVATTNVCVTLVAAL